MIYVREQGLLLSYASICMEISALQRLSWFYFNPISLFHYFVIIIFPLTCQVTADNTYQNLGFKIQIKITREITRTQKSLIDELWLIILTKSRKYQRTCIVKVQVYHAYNYQYLKIPTSIFKIVFFIKFVLRWNVNFIIKIRYFYNM